MSLCSHTTAWYYFTYRGWQNRRNAIKVDYGIVALSFANANQEIVSARETYEFNAVWARNGTREVSITIFTTKQLGLFSVERIP